VTANFSDIPDIFYVFCNTADLGCWHDLQFTHSITSAGIAACQDAAFLKTYQDGTADYFPFVPNSGRSTGFTSFFSAALTAEYRVEYDVERIRRMEFSRAPSRFSCVFAFGALEDCQKASQIYRWNIQEVRRFRLVDHRLNRVARVNMDVVSLMRSGYRKGSWTEDRSIAIWRHYWSGAEGLSIDIPAVENDRPTRRAMSVGTLWEYLIEGRLELID
jgi:hypothetical protein